MKITTIGIDIAKDVFQIHGVDEQGKVLIKRQLRRKEILRFFVNLPSCLIGMEACGGAHYWARELNKLGHIVKLMSPQFVKPYVKTNKHDSADAEAICEAVMRPNMRFVSVKSVDQQAILSVHRARQGFVKARTAQVNQIRGLLAESGIVMSRGIQTVKKRLPEILENGENGLSGIQRPLLQRLLEHLKELDRQVNELESEIHRWHQANESSQKLASIPGIGPLTASALVATIGNARDFKNGRQLAAWLGIVPKQHSSGGKQNLLGISKRGNSYLRTLLIHGTRSVIRCAESATEETWLGALLKRRNKNVVAVALANKNARIAWALLAKDSCFDSQLTTSCS